MWTKCRKGPVSCCWNLSFLEWVKFSRDPIKKIRQLLSSLGIGVVWTQGTHIKVLLLLGGTERFNKSKEVTICVLFS